MIFVTPRGMFHRNEACPKRIVLTTKAAGIGVTKKKEFTMLTKFQEAAWNYAESQVREGDNLNVVFESRRDGSRGKSMVFAGEEVVVSWDPRFNVMHVAKRTF